MLPLASYTGRVELTLLEIRDLHKVYGSGAKAVPALRGVDLKVERGTTVAIVGESGCGKTTLGRIVVGLQPATSGDVLLAGESVEVLTRSKQDRGRVQMVFQHPDTSLNPRFRAGTTVREPRRLMKGGERSDIESKVDEILQVVGLGPAYKDRRPRELSGGQQQRIAIARALICDPELVVLDEPTAALDQSVRGRVISLLRDIQAMSGVTYLLISHDLATVRRIADTVAVMYLGRVVEYADTAQLFAAPQHPYTKALLSAAPSLDPARRAERIVIPGETPNPADVPTGCAFQDRCPLVHDRCRSESPRLELTTPGHSVECFAVSDAADVAVAQ